MRITLKIDNVYEDGTVQTLQEVTVIPPTFQDAADDFTDWSEEQLLQHTGTGRTGRKDRNAAYFVKITACEDMPHLVGLEFEFGL